MESGYRNTTFTDHRGGSCLIMPWRADVLSRLVPCVFYIVHPDMTPEVFDGHTMVVVVEEYISGLPVDDRIRFEFYFLPGATDEECTAHYRSELAYRGTVWHQIKKVDEALQATGKKKASRKAVTRLWSRRNICPGARRRVPSHNRA